VAAGLRKTTNRKHSHPTLHDRREKGTEFSRNPNGDLKYSVKSFGQDEQDAQDGDWPGLDGHPVRLVNPVKKPVGQV
jgi:hypothetical protein